MASDAENVLSSKLEENTNCAPDMKTRSSTDLNMDTPPTTIGIPQAGKTVRTNESPYIAGQMDKPKKRKRKVALGAVVLGGLVAGGLALLNKQDKRSSFSKNIGSSVAGWLPNGEPVTIRKRRTVRAKSSAVYAEWRKLENLPNILSHLKEVKVLDEQRSYWEVKGPAGTSVSWYATITEDEPGRAISWQAEKEAEVPNSGRVTFSETPKGDTLIEVRLTYQPPAGDLGRAIAGAFGENPAKQIEDDLTNFKFSMEEKAEAAEATEAKATKKSSKSTKAS